MRGSGRSAVDFAHVDDEGGCVVTIDVHVAEVDNVVEVDVVADVLLKVEMAAGGVGREQVVEAEDGP